MPETEVEQQPTANTEAVKEEKKEMVEEATKNEDGSEKKDEAEKKEKVEPEKKEKVEKKKVVKEVVPPPPAVHKKDFEKDVVYLYQFNRTAVIPSMSLYCLKVETWLKLNGIKYEVGDLNNHISFRPLFFFVVKVPNVLLSFNDSEMKPHCSGKSINCFIFC